MGQVRWTIHFPLGGDTEGALGLPCQPASCQGGPGSVELLPAAERDVRQPHLGGADGYVQSLEHSIQGSTKLAPGKCAGPTSYGTV